MLLALFVVALLASVTTANDSCDLFAIRNRGDTLFYIDSSNGVLGIPNDLEVGSVLTTQILLGDYLLNVYPTSSGETLGIRKRIMDETTGKYKVPNTVLQFALDGTHVLYNNEIRDVSEFTLYELRDYLRIARADELGMEGHNDPFNLQAAFDASGAFCKEGPTCVSTMEDIFEEVTMGTGSSVEDSMNAMWELLAGSPQAGDDDYDGEIQNIFTAESDGEWVYVNENDIQQGSPRFRLMDDEVEDVFVLEAVVMEDGWEVIPGIWLDVWGWRGGQVMDFSFDDDGHLNGGHIVVGPHPASDPNDVVHWDVVAGWGGLWPQVPGPALRLGFLRNTRIYVSNWLEVGEDEEDADYTFTPSWVSLEVPHDQSDLSVWPTSTVVYEFNVRNMGTQMYELWEHDDEGAGSGPILIDYADMAWEADREYVAFVTELPHSSQTINGQSFPGTAQRLSGWYRDTIAIRNSFRSGDGEEVIITIDDSPRPSAFSSNEDSHFPDLAYDCPAHGGPILGRIGTGCIDDDGNHVNKGHQISSETYAPGTIVHIWDHDDAAEWPYGTINGVQRARRISSTQFAILAPGNNGTTGGKGGFVSIWRLHKADPENEEAQNNGVSGGYFRFNYGESIHMRIANAHGDPVSLRTQGHQFSVFANDGYTLDVPYVQSEVTVAGGSSADVLIAANNPNRYGAWILAATDPELKVNPFTPWSGAPDAPGGLISFIDYTGHQQGTWALDDEGMLQDFWDLPPWCQAERYVIPLLRDPAGEAVDVDMDTFWVWLEGSVSFETGISGMGEVEDIVFPLGEVTSHMWTVVDQPDGADVAIWDATSLNTIVTGFSEDGLYLFEFTANGLHDGANSEVTCSPASVLVLVSSELPETSEHVEILKEPTFVRIAGNAPDREEMSYPRGVATFQLREATASFEHNHITLTNLQIEAVNQTSWAPVELYRWFAPGGSDSQNVDYWLDIPSDPISNDASDWNWAVKKFVLDARVTSHGFHFGTDIGGWDDMPPAHSRVIYPLWQGSSTAGADFNSRHDVYFLILESSDEEFCELYGCAYTPTLSSVPIEALNEATLYRTQGQPSVKNEILRLKSNTGTFAEDRATEFLFSTDPGNVPATSEDDDTGYSPLKLFRFVGRSGVSRSVIANMPFVYWGLRDVQRGAPTAWELKHERKMLLVDKVWDQDNSGKIEDWEYCNSFIRSYPSNPTRDNWREDVTWRDGRDPTTDMSGFWSEYDMDHNDTSKPTGGPPMCAEEGHKWPSERQYGGQLLAVPNFKKMYAVFKVHRAVSGGANMDVMPYFSITDTSDYAEAQFNGVVWSPVLKELGRYGDIPAVASYKQFGNGVAGEGMYGYQDSIVSVVPGTTAWTSFWHITNLFWNCGTYWFGTDVWEGDFQPIVFQNVINADQSWRASDNALLLTPAEIEAWYDEWNYYDQYDLAANLKWTTCNEFTADWTGRDNGMVFALEEWGLLDEGVLMETEQPAGSWLVDDETDWFVISNNFVPFTFDMSAHHNPEDFVLSLDILLQYEPLQVENDPIHVAIPGIWVLLNRIAVDTELGWEDHIIAATAIQDDNNHDDFWSYETLWEWVPTLDGFSTRWNLVEGVQATSFNSSLPVIGFDLSNVEDFPERNADIKYAIIECDDALFADIVGAAYTPALAYIDDLATTWASTWWEPESDWDGFYHPQDVERALRSFIFYESPPDVSRMGGRGDPRGPLYTPFKRFVFDDHVVTCNMPFYSWGPNATHQMAWDLGGCSSQFGSSLDLNVTADGPPGCFDGQHPLTRSTGGQVLAANLDRRSGVSLNELDFTVKLHRAIRRDDGVLPYFAFFDTSDEVLASFFGIPYSGRLLNAPNPERRDLANSIANMYVFVNGKPCPDCTGFGFQDPIASVIDTPLQRLGLAYWDCQLNFSRRVTDFTDDLEVACPEAGEDAVAKEVIDSEWIHYADVEVLEDDNRVYVAWGTGSYVNAPFIAELTIPMDME